MDEEGAPQGMLTYLEMRRCLLRLGYTWNRSLPAAAGNASPNYYDDDISVASVNSSSTFLSGQNTANASNVSASARDIIATDAQLIMLLTTLVEMEEQVRAMKIKNDEEGENDDNATAAKNKGLFLPEFIQAYKLIIGGMQSLQTYPNPDVDRPEVVKTACGSLKIDPKLLTSLRQRSRERTLGLLRLFGPKELQMTDSISSCVKGRDSPVQSAGESPTSRNPPNRGKNRAPSPNVMSHQRSILPKDGLQPRLSDAEIRKLVHSKDTALAKILEEHESEMNVMATNMEELRMKEARIQAALVKRKKRTRLAVILGVIFTICGGAGMEYYRQEQVAREIATGREVERAADAETIRNLKAKVKDLTSKLQDAEATIRYEEGRYESIKASSTKTTKELEAMQVKWMMDQSELEKCRVQRKELDGDLAKLTTQHESISEEVGWCRERLESTERAMEGMERALKAKNEADGGLAPTFKEITKSIDAESDAAEKQDGKGKNNKPVQMEMKYNRSFRNAVLLRQLYSGVAGMVASVVAQGLFPGLVKVFSMLFLGV